MHNPTASRSLLTLKRLLRVDLFWHYSALCPSPETLVISRITHRLGSSFSNTFGLPQLQSTRMPTTLTYELCLLHMSHVFYIWVMSVTYESCLLHMSHVCYIWVMSVIYESCRLHMSHVCYMWVMSVIHESCLLHMSHVCYIWVTSPVHHSLVH